MEKDANSIMGAIADYFSISTHITTPIMADLNGGNNITLTGSNAGAIAGTNPNVVITVTVTDGSSRCPTDYQNPISQANSPLGFWSSAIPGVYTKIMQQ